METKTHGEIFTGKITQVEVGTSFPTSREVPEYLVNSNDDGLDDGDIYYVSGTGVLGVHVGGGWQLIEFTPVT